jgi:hypothetical protein
VLGKIPETKGIELEDMAGEAYKRA